MDHFFADSRTEARTHDAQRHLARPKAVDLDGSTKFFQTRLYAFAYFFLRYLDRHLTFEGTGLLY